ncbi:MAG: tetratricopeptide repeat protein [Flavobacteriaceae bacterium]
MRAFFRTYSLVFITFFAWNLGAQSIYEAPDKVIEKGNRMLENPDVTTRIEGLILISRAYSSKRDYQKSLEYALEAKSLLSKTDNVLSYIKVMDRIAIQYEQLGIYDKAFETLNEYESLCLEYPVADSVRRYLGNNYLVRGFVYKNQLNCEIAIGYFNKSISEYLKINTKQINANLSIATYNKGNCYIMLSDYQEAKANFTESADFADKVLAKSLKAFAYKGLAEVYTLEGSYTQAIELLDHALEISDNVGDLVLNRGIYEGLSQSYLAIDNMEKYQLYNAKFAETQDEIRTSERQSVDDSIRVYEETLQTQLQQDKPRFVYGVTAVLLGCFLLLGLIVFNEKRTRKKVNSLQKQIEILQKKNPS